MSQPALEIETGPQPDAAIIWLHGLGADGHDFEPIVPELARPGMPPLRFVFPHAPVRPVTLNGGYAMRAWYDIIAIDRRTREDEPGIRASQALVEQLIGRENARGIRSERIVLAGFSQGGAMALFAGLRHARPLAGIIGLSCYLLLGDRLLPERGAANAHTPIFLAHGTQDPVVLPFLGDEAHRALAAAGHEVEWHAYPMPHSVSPQEVADLAGWLRRVLAAERT
ncbi:MAG: carboxylesterase [Gammaproteobacteria bacterium]|nr:carboxylesterase [Gammaproteobacteria bacterium]